MYIFCLGESVCSPVFVAATGQLSCEPSFLQTNCSKEVTRDGQIINYCKKVVKFCIDALHIERKYGKIIVISKLAVEEVSFFGGLRVVLLQLLSIHDRVVGVTNLGVLLLWIKHCIRSWTDKFGHFYACVREMTGQRPPARGNMSTTSDLTCSAMQVKQCGREPWIQRG